MTVKFLRVVVPACPPSALSPNARHAHWAQRYAHQQAASGIARYAAVKEHPAGLPWPEGTPLNLELHIAWGKRRKRMDYDNAVAACKSYLDGVAAALGFNDRDIARISLTQGRDSSVEGFTQFVVKPAEEPA